MKSTTKFDLFCIAAGALLAICVAALTVCVFMIGWGLTILIPHLLHR